MEGYSLGNGPKKPHVVYEPNGERLGVSHIKYDGDNPLAIVRRGVLGAVKPNTDPRRPRTFVAPNPEAFRRFR